MAQKYTIEQFLPTGEEHATFGKEYHIKFAEDAGTYKLWYKAEPKNGQVQEGTIEGERFKKYRQPYTAKTESAAAPKKTYGAVEKDKQDGQRQGMCINNAANYLASKPNIEFVRPDTWAGAVHAYAKALYDLGDLATDVTVPAAPDQPEPRSTAENIADIFGTAKPKES
jgi:hypothetical protein